ncbi:carboxymuconolactone decarboxylase family protein [Flindersiella endophytica]
MEARLNVMANPNAGKVLKHLMATGRAMVDLGLSTSLRELVSLRVSQINGCAVCVDMHVKEAAAAGETAVRLNLVATWREAAVFTEAERAALELAEQGTRMADAASGVPDDVWANAAKHFDEDQLTALVMTISVMNTMNRLNVMTQQPAKGDYVAGAFH